MGRPSKLTEDELRKVARKFAMARDDEAGIAAVFRLHAIFGDMHKAIGSARVQRARFEYPVDGCRIDLLCFHVGGGVSIVEFKGDRDLREVVSGIGQLFLYETLLRELWKSKYSPAYIRRYLVSPIQGVSAEKVSVACASAGIDFVQCASFDLIKAERDAFLKNRVGHGSQVVTDA